MTKQYSRTSKKFHAYETSSTVRKLAEEQFEIKIVYERANNPRISNSWWGTTTIFLDRRDWAGDVYWDDDDDKMHNGHVEFEVVHAAEAEESPGSSVEPERSGGAGQGYGLTHEERCLVEERAMTVAREALVAAGFESIQDVSKSKSYDYSARKADVDWPVEVKGTTAKVADTFLLTAPEHKLHTERQGKTVLVIVSGIKLNNQASGLAASGGIAEMCEPWAMHEWEFVPTAYQARRKR